MNTTPIYKFFMDVNQMGMWPAISAICALAGVIIALKFVRTRAYTRGLNFFIKHQRDTSYYSSTVMIEIRNYSGKTVVITNPYFKFGEDICPDENARCDSYVKEYEIKFGGESKVEVDKDTGKPQTVKYLNEVDVMLRHKETTSTWIPISASEDDSKVKSALEKHKIGVLYCNVVWLEDKPRVIRIRKKI